MALDNSTTQQQRHQSALTKQQIFAASRLFQDRPAVHPGTRAILDEQQAKDWHARVTAEINRLEIVDPRAVNDFCDLAGVAD